MIKTVVKSIVFVTVFLVSLVVVSKMMNKGHDNLTMEMAPATLPMVVMDMEGMEYNQLHGYSQGMDPAFQRDTVTVLGESRNTGFAVDTYGAEVAGISIEVRSADGRRLIENTPVTDYTLDGDRIRGELSLKDLIEKDTEYSLTILLQLAEGREIAYYTRVVWSDQLYGIRDAWTFMRSSMTKRRPRS